MVPSNLTFLISYSIIYRVINMKRTALLSLIITLFLTFQPLVVSPVLATNEGKDTPSTHSQSDEAHAKNEARKEDSKPEQTLTDNSTQGKSHSNPDGEGVDKPYPADNQPAMSQ